MAKSPLVLSLARRAAHSPIGRRFIGWFFAHLSFLLPVCRLYESERLLAFRHPSPVYPFHVLLVPKKAVADLGTLVSGDSRLMVEVFQATHQLVKKYGLEKDGYRLIVNGGAYQDVPQLHFHLVGERGSDE